jgi:NAD(P)H dehydrogenase (quinone)
MGMGGRIIMKAAIIFDSKTGHTAKAADYMAMGMKAAGIEAACFNITAVDGAYVQDADLLVFGAPTYMASITPDMIRWLQSEGPKLHLSGKLGGAFATEQYIHGGADLVIQTLLTHELVLGMMVYSSGVAYGKPVIHLGPVGMGPHIADFKELFITYGKRMAEQAKLIWSVQ